MVRTPGFHPGNRGSIPLGVTTGDFPDWKVFCVSKISDILVVPYKDATERHKKHTYKALYVKQEEWDKYKPDDFATLLATSD